MDSATSAQPAAKITDWDTCMDSLKKVFRLINKAEDAINTLHNLRHTSSVDDYASEYRRLAPKTKYGDAPLCTMFESGLKVEIRTCFVGRAKPQTLEEWIWDAATIEQDLAQLKGKQPAAKPNWFAQTRAQHRDPNAMELDQMTTAERECRRTLGLCFYCGQADHALAKCPVKHICKAASRHIRCLDRSVLFGELHSPLSSITF